MFAQSVDCEEPSAQSNSNLSGCSVEYHERKSLDQDSSPLSVVPEVHPTTTATVVPSFIGVAETIPHVAPETEAVLNAFISE